MTGNTTSNATDRSDRRTPLGARGEFRSALEGLRSSQKPGAGVPAYLRWVNRWLGRYAAAAASVIGLTPNAVTAIGAFVSLIGLVLIAVAGGTLGGAIAAAVLLLVGYALDSADGQLARLTGTGSKAGEWIDHVVDATRLPLTHLAIAIGLFLRESAPWTIAAALAFLIVDSVWFFAQTLAEKLSGSASLGSTAPAWVSFAKLPYDSAALYFVVATLALLPLFLVLYLSLLVFSFFVALISLRRKYRMLLADPA